MRLQGLFFVGRPEYRGGRAGSGRAQLFALPLRLLRPHGGEGRSDEKRASPGIPRGAQPCPFVPNPFQRALFMAFKPPLAKEELHDY